MPELHPKMYDLTLRLSSGLEQVRRSIQRAPVASAAALFVPVIAPEDTSAGGADAGAMEVN